MLRIIDWDLVDGPVAPCLDHAIALAPIPRRLGCQDRAYIERHLLMLAPSDRMARFGRALSETAIRAYVQTLDPQRCVLMGSINERADVLVGLAEAQPTGVPGRVEMAVSVQASYRRRGLGRRLVAAAMAAAFACGAEAAELRFDPGNSNAVGLLRKLRAQPLELGLAEIRSGGSIIPDDGAANEGARPSDR